MRVDPVDQGNGAGAWEDIHRRKAPEDLVRSEELNRLCGLKPKEPEEPRQVESPRPGRLCSVCQTEGIRSDNASGVCYRCRVAPASGRAKARGMVVDLEKLTEDKLRALMDLAAAEIRRRRGVSRT